MTTNYNVLKRNQEQAFEDGELCQNCRYKWTDVEPHGEHTRFCALIDAPRGFRNLPKPAVSECPANHAYS